MDILIIVGVVVVLAFVFIMAALLMLKAFYFKVEQGKALIINGVSKQWRFTCVLMKQNKTSLKLPNRLGLKELQTKWRSMSCLMLSSQKR